MRSRIVSTGKKKNAAAASGRSGGSGKIAYGAPAAAGPTAQLFPYKRRNTRTNRTFRITEDGGQIDAVQIAGDEEDPHSGYLTYAIRQNCVELGHIASDPEEGSGIGSLLTLFLAQIAQQNGKDRIEIPTAAPTAVGFYELLGFESANKEGAANVEAQLADNESVIATEMERYIALRAKIEFETDPENHKLKQRGSGPAKTRLRFDQISGSQQEELKQAQLIKFGEKTNTERQRILASLLHGRAVMLTGMVGDVDTIISRATALCARWEQVTDWTPENALEVWNSRNDPTTLTEFPRDPTE